MIVAQVRWGNAGVDGRGWSPGGGMGGAGGCEGWVIPLASRSATLVVRMVFSQQELGRYCSRRGGCGLSGNPFQLVELLDQPRDDSGELGHFQGDF